MMTWFLAWLLVLVCGICSLVQARAPLISDASLSLWGISHRGTDLQDDSGYTTVGVLTPLTGSSSGVHSQSQQQQHRSKSTRLILQEAATNSSFVTVSRPNDDAPLVGRLKPLDTNETDDASSHAMVKALGMVCDVMVVWMDPVKTHQSQQTLLLGSLFKGVQRRVLSGRPKPKLVVVAIDSKDTNDKEHHEETKRHLMLRELKDLTPKDFDTLDVVTTTTELAQVLDDILQEEPTHGEEPIVELSAFPTLLQEIYKFLTHHSKKLPPITLEAWKEEPQENVALAEKNETTAGPQHTQEEPPTEDQQEQVTRDWTEVTHEVLSQAQVQLNALESKQEDVWLNPASQVPLLEFGEEADVILDQAHKILEQQDAPPDLRRVLMLQVATDVRRLYQQQLDSLREHYGRRYESVLLEEDTDEQACTVAAARATEAFRAAAQHAIPKRCREGQELRDAEFGYVSTLQGLISDMMEATSLREDNAAASNEVEEEDSSKKRPAKWYEKLAARAVVLGINYLQGWLAWRGIRKAAEERDRNMPKFPLF